MEQVLSLSFSLSFKKTHRQNRRKRNHTASSALKRWDVGAGSFLDPPHAEEPRTPKPRRPALRGLVSAAALPPLPLSSEEVLLPKATAFVPAPRRLLFFVTLSVAAADSRAPPSSVTLLLLPERGDETFPPCSDSSLVVAEGASGHSAAASAAALLRLRT